MRTRSGSGHASSKKCRTGWNLDAATTEAHESVSSVWKENLVRHLPADTFAPRNHTRERKEERQGGKEGERGEGRRKWGIGITAYPRRRRRRHRPIHQGPPTLTAVVAGIRVLRADDVNGTWVGSRELATPAACGIIDVDKVRVAGSLAWTVMVMIIVVERIKRSRRE